MYFLSFREIHTASTAVLSPTLYKFTPPTNRPVDWNKWQLTTAVPIDWSDLDKVDHSHVCFVVHGFNVDRKRGARSGAAISQELGPLGSLNPSLKLTDADLIIPVLWPGDGFIGWSYFTAFSQAHKTGEAFAKFLLNPGFDADEVSFISHSLGARVVLRSIDQTLARAKGRPKFRFNKTILAAAAVDTDALDSDEFPHISSQDGPSEIVVLSSMKDSVLRTFFTIGDEIEGAMWDNYDGTGRALGRYGPELSPGSRVRDKTRWYDFQGKANQGHDGYMPDHDRYPVEGNVAVSGWSTNIIKTWTFCGDMLDNQPSSVGMDWLSQKPI
jgi:hypothetical protein